jgi:hypothetical protein
MDFGLAAAPFMPLKGVPIEETFREWNTSSIVGFLIVLLVTSLFIFVAAKLTGEGEGFGTALATALVGSLLFGLVLFLLPNKVGLVLAVVVWGAVAAGFYRTRWLKGLLIGIVAWLLAYLTLWILGSF